MEQWWKRGLIKQSSFINFPYGDVCLSCVAGEIGVTISTDEEMRKLPGDWDDD